MLYTASFFNMGDFKGESVCVANSYPSWFKGNNLVSFNPPWKAVQQLKDGKISWQDFSKKYSDHLESENTEEDLQYIKEALNKGDITLLCWEHHAGRCHRRLLYEWLCNKLHIEKELENVK